MASFLTTGMRFLLNKKVGLFYLSFCKKYSFLSGCVFVIDIPTFLTSMSKRSVQLWIMLLWFMWMQCWRQYLWEQRLIDTLGLIILWVLTRWSHPEALTWTSGSGSSPYKHDITGASLIPTHCVLFLGDVFWTYGSEWHTDEPSCWTNHQRVRQDGVSCFVGVFLWQWNVLLLQSRNIPDGHS